MSLFKVTFAKPIVVWAYSEYEARDMVADEFDAFDVEPDDLLAELVPNDNAP